MYKVGLPFWKTLARAGVPVALRVNVSYDPEAKVFIATSKDLSGLVVEAGSIEDLVRETGGAVSMLMEDCVDNARRLPEPVYRFRRDAVPA